MIKKRFKVDGEAISEADVIITDEAGYTAVGVRYERKSMLVPVVVSCETGSGARTAISAARDAEVTVHEHDALAEELYRSVGVGEEIPPSLYQSVAEILARVLVDQGE